MKIFLKNTSTNTHKMNTHKSGVAIMAMISSVVLFGSQVALAGSKLKTEEDKFSYIMGLEMGARMNHQFMQQGMELNMEIVAEGIIDGASGDKPRLSKEEIEEVVKSVGGKLEEKQKELAAAHEKEMKEKGDYNKNQGEEFLKQNKKKEGVVTTKSGLQYKVLKEGKGPKPSATDTVTVNYKGNLLDGTEFDSSYKRGEPATFAVNAVIPGWTEALQLMPEGSKWEVYIPSDLAYGPGGTGGPIGPNATLVFEIELLKSSNKSGD